MITQVEQIGSCWFGMPENVKAKLQVHMLNLVKYFVIK